MQVRRATEDDRARWRELRAALEPERAPAGHDAEITAILQQRFHRVAFVCVEEGGSVLGFAEASRGLIPGARPGTAACLDRVGLCAGAGEAVAQALMAAVESWTRAHGCTLLISAVAEGDAPGRVLRERLGFSEPRGQVLYSKCIEAPAAATHDEASADLQDDAAQADEAQWLPAGLRLALGDGRALRVAGHGLLFALGGCALLYTDIWSEHPLYGGVLPILDALFVIYVLGLVSTLLYRRRTASRDPAYLLDTETSAGPVPLGAQASAGAACTPGGDGSRGPDEPPRGRAASEARPAPGSRAPDVGAVELAGSPPRSRFADDER